MNNIDCGGNQFSNLSENTVLRILACSHAQLLHIKVLAMKLLLSYSMVFHVVRGLLGYGNITLGLLPNDLRFLTLAFRFRI